jgi:4-hydroxy-2-oxoheptanedioate aldolase
MKRTLDAGGVVFGPFIGTAAPALVEICGIAGFDYVVIDCEHSSIDLGDCVDMIRAAELAGVTAIVRVPGHDPKAILRYLDIGAQGIMAPSVSTVAEARAIVDASKYAPIGKRGLGPGRSARYGLTMPLPEYVRLENDEVLVIAQLENVRALDELDDLVRVPGVDIFMLGTADLSASMGLPGQRTHPRVAEVRDRFIDAVLAAGRIVGDTAETPEAAAAMSRRGFRMLDCGLEQIAARAALQLVEGVRTAIAEAKPATAAVDS